MKPRWPRFAGAAVLLLLLGGVAAFAWRNASPSRPGDGFASGNVRIEAVGIDIATEQPGRVAEILVEEGDLVKPGQILARMDWQSLQTQRSEALAREQQARDAAAGALVVQRMSELDAARRRLARSAAPSWPLATRTSHPCRRACAVPSRRRSPCRRRRSRSTGQTLAWTGAARPSCW